MPSRNRRSIRKRNHDYTRSGCYFLTFNTYRNAHLFGRVVDGQMHLSPYGQCVVDVWNETPAIRPELIQDAFIVMPNHVHCIVAFRVPDEQPGNPVDTCDVAHRPNLWRAPRSLGSFVAGFKSTVAARINALRKTPGRRVWHRNYWDVLIRDRRALQRIRTYIEQNPRQWGKKRRPRRASSSR